MNGTDNKGLAIGEEQTRVGEAIRLARKSQKLTQTQLGERIGVGKAHISRIESGDCATLTTISRVFKAMGVSVCIDIDGVGKIPL